MKKHPDERTTPLESDRMLRMARAAATTRRTELSSEAKADIRQMHREGKTRDEIHARHGGDSHPLNFYTKVKRELGLRMRQGRHAHGGDETTMTRRDQGTDYRPYRPKRLKEDTELKSFRRFIIDEAVDVSPASLRGKDSGPAPDADKKRKKPMDGKRPANPDAGDDEVSESAGSLLRAHEREIERGDGGPIHDRYHHKPDTEGVSSHTTHRGWLHTIRHPMTGKLVHRWEQSHTNYDNQSESVGGRLSKPAPLTDADSHLGRHEDFAVRRTSPGRYHWIATSPHLAGQGRGGFKTSKEAYDHFHRQMGWKTQESVEENRLERGGAKSYVEREGEKVRQAQDAAQAQAEEEEKKFGKDKKDDGDDDNDDKKPPFGKKKDKDDDDDKKSKDKKDDGDKDDDEKDKKPPFGKKKEDDKDKDVKNESREVDYLAKHYLKLWGYPQ